MAKVSYRTCDICNRNISTSRGLDGVRLHISLFRKIEICNRCMQHLAKFDEELQNEASLYEQAVTNAKKYDDTDRQAIYLEGFEFAVNTVLLKNRIKRGNIK